MQRLRCALLPRATPPTIQGAVRRPLGLVLSVRRDRVPRRELVRAQGQVEKVDASGLEIAIAERDRPIVIDFYATWCGPCLMLAKELEAVAADMGDAVKILKVDCDEEEDLAQQLQIRGLPTLVFISPDKTKPALRTEGMLPADQIKEIIINELQ